MQTRKTTLTSENGQSMVELASVLVILFILVAGAMDLGRAFFSFMALRDAAQEGAVYGSVCPTDKTKIETRVRSSSAEPIDLTSADVLVDCVYTVSGQPACGTTTPNPGDGIKVTVTYQNFNITTPFLGTILGRQTFELKAEATDTILRDTCP